MVSKSFLDFIDEHERKMDDYVRSEDERADERELEEDVEEVVPVKRVVPKPVVKIVPKVVAKPVVKESKSFSFCTACGQKLPQNISGKFCPFCGKPSLMSTNGTNKVATKKNGISEDVDYASALLDEDTPMEQSRMLEYLEKNPPKNPMMEILKNNQNTGESAMDRASELLDGTSELGAVKLLEMPDMSRFMPKKEENKDVQQIPDIPMLPPIQGVDADIQNQLAQLGLI